MVASRASCPSLLGVHRKGGAEQEEIKMPILSANRIGGVRKDNRSFSGASTFGVGAFPMSNIT